MLKDWECLIKQRSFGYLFERKTMQEFLEFDEINHRDESFEEALSKDIKSYEYDYVSAQTINHQEALLYRRFIKTLKSIKRRFNDITGTPK